MKWTADTVQAEITQILQAFNPNRVELTPETSLTGDLGLDSLAAMNLVMELEDRFDIDIPINLLPDVHSLQDLVDTVLGRLRDD
jgi:acyl carrier protein